MISTTLLNFTDSSNFFFENFSSRQDFFYFEDLSSFLYLFNFSDYNFLFLNKNSKFYTQSLITFLNQTEDLDLFSNLENVKTIYHYSIPNVKLSYPEPFIASASFMHTDIWFVHILVYQYWLWFIFIFLIVFFFLTFICVVRWCNMRVRPRRETRGVSRSKCADLITAIVPVSWATSIIVSESTDAIDYYDGFGTTELVVGIRAYQWGWEYYYPKDIDLHYNIKHNYSTFVGNSLKYNSTTDLNLRSNNLWKFYQNKSLDSIITPAHLIVLPIDNFKLLNFMTLNDAGSNPLIESAAFKKTRMISKTFHSNLTTPNTNFSNKFTPLTTFFNNENQYLDSLNYGFRRQHTFLSNLNTFNNNNTFFNVNNSSKWLVTNFKNDFNILKSFNGLFNFNFFEKNNKNNFTLNSSRFYNFFNKKNPYNANSTLINSFNYPNLLAIINNDSDKKKIKQPLFKLFNLPLNKLNLNSLNTLSNLSFSNDLYLSSLNFDKNIFINVNKSYKLFSSFSSNQSVPLSNKSARFFVKMSPQVTSYNFSPSLNLVNEYADYFKTNLNNSEFLFYNFAQTNWASLSTVNKISSSRVYADYPSSPIVSNYPYINFFKYDDYKNTYVKNVPNVLQGKEDQMPIAIPSIYWNLYWGNTNIEWRVLNGLNYNKIHSNFYLPLFNFYYDYDFKNWQSLELLEDAYWESIISSYTFDEYANLSEDFNQETYLDKIGNLFYQFNKNQDFRIKPILKSYFKTFLSTGEFYSNSFYLDDFITNSKLLQTNNFFFIPFFSAQINIDDSYESLKFLNYIYNVSNKPFFNFSTVFFNPYSYSFVFDMFRSDYDEFSWFIDEKNFSSFKIPNELLQFIYTYFNSNKNIFSYFNANDELFLSKDIRFSNHLNLRSSVKNAIVSYNAIQKVFRARFDEGRSNLKIVDFGNFFNKQPYLSTNRIQYEKLLGKNKENFFKINFYKLTFLNFFNNLYSTTSSFNFYVFDFPFLLGMKSDASKHFWFDWFAKWGFYEVQPSSASRYALYGMPYFSKNFEFSTQIGELLNETETYFLRLSRARKNYLPNWVYTPYLYSKINTWYQNHIIYDVLNLSENNLGGTVLTLRFMDWYWNKLFFLNFNSYIFTPSNSNINTYTRGTWKPQSSIQSYFYSVSALIDILTKREYLYRQLLESNNKLINLPFYLTSNPNNPLINELKAAFLFVDPIVFNNEYSRDAYYNSLSFFKFNILKSLVRASSDLINLTPITDYLFFFFFNTTDTKLGNNFELYKNQYRPLRKGISNMIKLHATGAIAMPTEIRLQILASSKDVIHSWAIPSAGIKIDCVPGYSSHKVAIFLVSGIFWGQCMEICGRYHHWMPIIVYFMKRDLFFLWCTHFVFASGSNNMWSINDRQYTDYIRLVSYDKNSWINEMSL